MSKRASAYFYTCDRCGQEWEVRAEEREVDTPYGKTRKMVTEGMHPSRVAFPGIHDGGGRPTKDSEWDVCLPCWDIIRRPQEEPTPLFSDEPAPAHCDQCEDFACEGECDG